MAGLSQSDPVRSTSKQKDNISMSTTRLPSKTQMHPRQGGLPLPPCPCDWTQLFADVGDLGPDSPTWRRVCGPRWAVYRAWAQNYQEMAWLGLCLPQTPWSPVSKKQKQDLSVPGVAGTTWWLPWTKLGLLGRGLQGRQKPAPGLVWALGFPFSLREGVKKKVHPRCPRTMAFRIPVPGGTVAWPGVGPSPSRARGASLPGATGARLRGGEGLGPGAGCWRWGPGGRPRSGGGHSPSGGTVFSVCSG